MEVGDWISHSISWPRYDLYSVLLAPSCMQSWRPIKGVILENPHDIAKAFGDAFGEAEYALKRSGFLKKGIVVAEADWDEFSKKLGAAFYADIVAKQIATTLIGRPPRVYLATGEWSPDNLPRLANVNMLIVMGMCRVRNSYIHGEKFRGGPAGQWDRDIILVKEAHDVLNAALAWPHDARI